MDIATAPDDAAVLYYATRSNIYKSVDSGASFSLWPLSPGGAGADNIDISAIAVTLRDGNHIIAVATADSDNSQYGGVYLLDENEPFGGWINTGIGNYDVIALAFSPGYSLDRQLVAVVTDETDTLVVTRNGDAGWGGVIGDAIIGGLVPGAAAIAFPDDYDATAGDYLLFVALDGGGDTGDVYRVNGRRLPESSLAADLDIGSLYNLADVDVTGLVLSGNTTSAHLLAGAANSARVYSSTDGGLNWIRSDKEPTGQSLTYLLMAPDFLSSAIAYAATSGDSSAFSATADAGLTWNQLALIDTVITTIVGLAPSPDYQLDSRLFLLTFDGGDNENSLWRSLDAGAGWERMFTSTLADADSITRLALSPRYGQAGQLVYLAGTDGANSAIWRSNDNGQTFKRRELPFLIDAWAVVDDDSLFLGSYNGTDGLFHRATGGGSVLSGAVAAGSQTIKSIVPSPNYDQDGIILLGNNNGWVYLSADNGASFQPLPADAASPPLTGSITIAFDPEFAANNTVYAASSTADKGIYRFIIGSSTAWDSIDGALPAGARISKLLVSPGGSLYAANLKADGGIERCLNPTYPLGPAFETVTRGLDQSATLVGLWQQGNQLWSIDSQNTRLMTYIDSLTRPVILTSPPLSAAGSANGRLEWQTLPGATEYKWQLNDNTNFSILPDGFENNTGAASARLPALEPAVTYHWRVRVTRPVLSPWSAKWSFTTSLGATVIAPELYSPEAGAGAVPLKPVFQWSAIAGAGSYELLVSGDVSFASPVIVKVADYALPVTAWQSNVSLEEATTYYWKVRASGPDSYSAWSPVGAFTTVSPSPSTVPAPDTLASSVVSSTLPNSLSPLSAAPPAVSYSLPPPPPVAAPAQPAALPDWILYLAGAVLLTVLLLLGILLVLVLDIRRSRT